MPTEPVEVATAYVGRTHRPCGACGALVWVDEGCPHIPLDGPRAPSSRTRNARRDAAAGKAKVAADYHRAARERAAYDVANFLRTL